MSGTPRRYVKVAQSGNRRAQAFCEDCGTPTRAIAAELSAWRRPLRPVLVVGGGVVMLTLIVAAWLGGWLPAPAWFAPIGAWVWSLPWP